MKKNPKKVDVDAKRKLGDIAVAVSVVALLHNAKKDKANPKIKRVASAGCCNYCMEREGTFSANEFESGRASQLHGGCRCHESVVFDERLDDLVSLAKSNNIDTELVREAYRYSQQGVLQYDKPLEDFLADYKKSRDLFVHVVMARNGHKLILRKENAPRGFSNIDTFWVDKGKTKKILTEIKSPDGNNQRAIERAVRDSVRQFAHHYPKSEKTVTMIFNSRYFMFGDEEAFSKLHFRKQEHNINRVILIDKSGQIREVN